MSYCYATDSSSDQTSLQHHYLDLMPESPLQHKLSSNNSPTSHIRFVQKKRRKKKNENVLLFFFHMCARTYVCKMNDVWRIAKREFPFGI
jgi:hypothetical protein